MLVFDSWGSYIFMSKFLTELVVEELTDTNWKIIEPFLYQSDIFGGIIEIPVGFPTDFASFIIARQWAHRAAVIHDYLYATHVTSKIMADRIFLEAMKLDGIWLWKRQLMFDAVFLFGWSSYTSGPSRLKLRTS